MTDPNYLRVVEEVRQVLTPNDIDPSRQDTSVTEPEIAKEADTSKIRTDGTPSNDGDYATRAWNPWMMACACESVVVSILAILAARELLPKR